MRLQLYHHGLQAESNGEAVFRSGQGDKEAPGGEGERQGCQGPGHRGPESNPGGTLQVPHPGTDFAGGRRGQLSQSESAGDEDQSPGGLWRSSPSEITKRQVCHQLWQDKHHQEGKDPSRRGNECPQICGRAGALEAGGECEGGRNHFMPPHYFGPGVPACRLQGRINIQQDCQFHQDWTGQGQSRHIHQLCIDSKKICNFIRNSPAEEISKLQAEQVLRGLRREHIGGGGGGGEERQSDQPMEEGGAGTGSGGGCGREEEQGGRSQGRRRGQGEQGLHPVDYHCGGDQGQVQPGRPGQLDSGPVFLRISGLAIFTIKGRAAALCRGVIPASSILTLL